MFKIYANIEESHFIPRCYLMATPRTKHQGKKYLSGGGRDLPKKLADGFIEWRYKDTGAAIPEALLTTVPNGDKIKISYARKVLLLQYPTPHDFVFFEVKRFSTTGTEYIGRITEYTTEERLTSLLYRYLHPDHAKSCTFEAKVSFRPNGSPYVELPDRVIEASGLVVDDEVCFTITSNGCSYSGHYHLSNLGVYWGVDGPKYRLILPLNQLKRLVVLGSEIKANNGRVLSKFQLVTPAVYNQHGLMLNLGEPLTYPYSRAQRKTNKKRSARPIIEYVPCRRFFEEGAGVTVELSPEERTVNDWPGARRGRFDFTMYTVKGGGARKVPGGGSND